MPRFIDDELKSHLEELTDDLVTQGLSVSAARTEAERQFGDLVTIKKEILQLHPFKRWPVLVVSSVLYLLIGSLLYASNSLLPPRGLLGLWNERLIINWWSWLALVMILLLAWWIIQFYSLTSKIVVPAVVGFALVCGISITSVLDIDNFEVNLHALAAAIIFSVVVMLTWPRLSMHWRQWLLLGFVLLLSWNAIRQEPLFDRLLPISCLYLTPDAVPLTGVLQQCRQLPWTNLMLWPLYGVVIVGGGWLVWYVAQLWRNRGTYWYRKVITTAALVVLPVLPLMKNNLNNQGELDVIPWKRDIYAAYWDILGRSPETKDFEFYASSRAYLHMSRIREVLYASPERRLKIKLLFKEVLGRKGTRREIRYYAKSYLTIEEITAELETAHLGSTSD